MMSRKFSNRERGLMLVLALLLVVCGYYFLVARPVSDAISNATLDREETESRLLVEEARAIRLDQMKQALDELEQESGGKVSEIPDYDNTQYVVRTLNAALAPSDSYNLVFNPVSFDGHIAKRTIEMAFTCPSYSAAQKIISQLYASPYRCSITALTLTAQGGQQSGDLSRDSVAVTLSITFYEYLAQLPDDADAS